MSTALHRNYDDASTARKSRGAPPLAVVTSDAQADLAERLRDWTPPTDAVPPAFTMTEYDTWKSELNSLGHAQAFANLFGRICRWCYKTLHWYVYDGRSWVEDDGELIGELRLRARQRYLDDAERLRGMIKKMAVGTEKADLRRSRLKQLLKKFRDHIGRNLATAKALDVMVASARDLKTTRPDGMPMKLTIGPDVFDRQRHLFNAQNCVVDLRLGTAIPHDPALMLSRIAPVVFHPGAQAPRFTAALLEMMGGDMERMRFLQRVIGYLFTAEARERKVVVFYGRNGKNGKTTLANVLKLVAGRMYTGGLPVATLLEKRFGRGEIDVGLTTLSGKRFVVAVEPSRPADHNGVKFDTGIIKTISGADVDGISARKPHQQELLVADPGCKVVLLTNHLPAWEDDEAFDERFLVIPFDEQFTMEREHKDLAQELVGSESAGILAWIVEGARLYYAHGLEVPSDILERAAARRADADRLGRWFEQCCARDGKAFASVRAMWKSYRWFLEAGGVPEKEWPSETAFAPMLDRFSTDRKRKRIPGHEHPTTVVGGIRLAIGEGGEAL